MNITSSITFTLEECHDESNICVACGLKKCEWIMITRFSEQVSLLGLHETCKLRHEDNNRKPSGFYSVVLEKAI